MDYIYSNPFRVLGLDIDSTERDKERNKAKARAFLKAKKPIRFENDIPLPVDVERTMESIEEASSQIQQSAGRIKFAHLWFWEGNPVDTKAFQLLRSDNQEEGVSLLLRNSDAKEISDRNYSSFRNLAIYYLSMLGPGMSFNKGLAEQGLRFLGKFFKSDYFDQFSRIAVGNSYPGRNVVLEDLCDVVFKKFKLWVNTGKISSTELVDWIDEFPEDIKKNVKNSFIAKPINDIASEINKAEETLDKGDEYGYYAGKKLYENAAPVLKRLEGLLGRSDYRYESAAEDVAKKMRICCFTYWEAELENGENDPGTRCLYLTERAYSLCPFGSFGEILKKDISQIKDWIDGAAERKKQEKAQDDIEVIVGYIEELQGPSNGSNQLSRCEYIIEQVEPVLRRIRGLLGQQSELVTKMSTALGSHIVGSLIEFTNKYASSASMYQRVSNAMSKLRGWSLESDFRAHLEKNYSIINQNASLATTAESRQSGGGKGCLVAIAAVFVIGFFINLFDSSGSSSKSNSRYSTPSYSSSSSASRYASTPSSSSRNTTVSQPNSNLTPQATPWHGKVFQVSGNQVAPFELKVPSGSSNYFVKLEDWNTGRTSIAFFVRGSSRSINIDVPIGTYRLKYASGTTWYGEDELFGQYTSYNQANSRMKFEVIGNQVSGHTVELIKRVNGNLRTSRLNSANF